MRYFLDTEFVEDGCTIMPISIALVSANGGELYAEFEFDEDKARRHDFVRENVLPHLRLERQPKETVALEIEDFVNNDPFPQLWAWYGSYDWVLFCQLYGTMQDLPRHFPMFIRDLKMVCVELRIPDHQLPPKPPNAHDALADARWLRDAHRVVERTIRVRTLRSSSPPNQRDNP